MQPRKLKVLWTALVIAFAKEINTQNFSKLEIV